jgi:hypothetical protein
MTRPQAILAGRLLEMAAREFHEHGCNDMPAEMFEGLLKSEVTELVEGFNTWDAQHWDPKDFLPMPLANIRDDQWMEYLAYITGATL